MIDLANSTQRTFFWINLMNFNTLIWVTILSFTFLGVVRMEASNQPTQKTWIPIKGRGKSFKARFPSQPIAMSFDIPLEGGHQIGHMNIYTALAGEGTLMLAEIHSPLFNGTELETKQFRKIFDSFIIRRMFYYPQIFNERAKYSEKHLTLHGNNALRFSFLYEEGQLRRKLAGLAVSKGKDLYILFYITLEKEFDEGLWQTFTDSFHFNAAS
jgi:hypothetical protein